MGPLSYFIAFVVIAFGAYYWHKMNTIKDKMQNKQSSKPKPKEKFLDFDRDCKIRKLLPSDLDTLRAMSKGSGGCTFFQTHSFLPYLDESAANCLGFGVEHRESAKIICSQFIMMTDENETGIVLGAMFDENYKSDSRILYMRLSNDVQAKLTEKYEHLGKHRSIRIVNERNYQNNDELDWQIKFNLDAMSDDNSFYFLRADGVKANDDGIKVSGDFKACEDVKKAVDLIGDCFKRSDVLFDFAMFQTKSFEQTLKKKYEKRKDFECFVNAKESALCLVHADSDYYVYGKDAKDILSAVRFALSSNKCDAEFVRVFASKAMVDQNEELIKLFEKAKNEKAIIVALDYDMHIDGH